MIEFFAANSSGRTAIGKTIIYEREKKNINRLDVDDTFAEVKRFENAKALVLECMRNDVSEGEESAEIVEAQLSILEDKEFNSLIVNTINVSRVNAEYAVYSACSHYSKLFNDSGDAVLIEKVSDVEEIADRIIEMLGGEISFSVCDLVNSSDEQVILIANSLNVGDIIRIGRNRLAGVYIGSAGIHSHSVIVAKSFGIPVLCGNLSDSEGKDFFGNQFVSGNQIIDSSYSEIAVIDGINKKIIFDADENTISHYRMAISNENDETALLKSYIGKQSITKSGKKIGIFANVNTVDELDNVIENDAEGIGLFRSEMILFAEETELISEERQFEIYKTVLERMKNKKVTIRTFDVRADKEIDNGSLHENCFYDDKWMEILQIQLRALYRASAYGKLHVMYPMIRSLKEVFNIKKLADSVKDNLEKEGIPTGEVKHGVMIETPEAALISEELAKHVDFFSIGSNDLSYYTLSVDRGSEEAGEINPYDETIINLIRLTVSNAHKEGITVGVCGELAADLFFIDKLIEFGIDEISVVPSKVLLMRKKICEC